MIKNQVVITNDKGLQMFNYVRAYVKNNNHWTEEDISTRTLVDLQSSYQNVRIIATYDVETSERGIDFKNNRYVLSRSDKTQDVTTWLAGLDPDMVSHDNTKVTFNEVQSVKHWNLYDLPVKITGANAKFGLGVPIPKGMTRDLELSSDVDDALEFSTVNISKNMLIAINGRICKMSSIDGRAFALDAYNKMDEGSNVMSAIDFTDVGGLQQVDITEDMVSEIIPTTLDNDMQRVRVTVDLPDISFDTTAILVMDGHLHVLDGSYKRLNDKMVINVNIPLALKRASRFKNFNHDFVASANVREKGIDGSTFDVKKYMHQTDTFIAFVNTNDLCIFKEPIQQTQTYGGYEHYRAPKGIVVSEEFEYMPHIFQEASAEHLAIVVADNIINRDIFKTSKFDPARPFANNKHTLIERKYKKAYIFEMYTF